MSPKRLTKEDVNNRLSGRGVLMIGEYVTTHSKTLFQCEDGHTWKATPANVMSGTGCPNCAGNTPLTKDIVNDRICGRGLVLLGEYVNNSTESEFRCSEGHIWTTRPDNVLSGYGCPKCGKRKAANKKRLTSKIINERLARRGIALVGEYKTANTKALFRCSEGHTWKATPGSVMNKNGCPYCSNRMPLTKEIVNERVANRGFVMLGEYGGSGTKTLFRCAAGHEWEVLPSSIMQGGGCPRCAGQAPLTREIVNSRIADRGFIMLGEYVNVDTKTMFQCDNGHTWEAAPEKVMSRTGCPYCSGMAPLTTEIVNARIEDRGLILVDEFVNNQTKVRFKCNEGHIWDAKPNNVLNGRGCPECSERTSDNDVFYLWVAASQSLVKLRPGDHLLKFGATSERLKSQRIREVASTWSTKPRVLALVKTSETALLAERTAANIGQRLTPGYSHLDGWTEFRVVNETELSQLMLIAEEAAEYKIVWDDPVANVSEFRLV